MLTTQKIVWHLDWCKNIAPATTCMQIIYGHKSHFVFDAANMNK